jgi:hypothetical protein
MILVLNELQDKFSNDKILFLSCLLSLKIYLISSLNLLKINQ